MNAKRLLKLLLVPVLFISACSEPPVETKTPSVVKDTLIRKDTVSETVAKPIIKFNDTLNDIAAIIAGNCESSSIFPKLVSSKVYKQYKNNFSKRWIKFDTARIKQLVGFHDTELAKEIKTEPTLFYPFSGPDFLYANLLFPEAEKYILLGLEPVGTLSAFEASVTDSLGPYLDKVNNSLNAILQFSFFRTNSMEADLKNGDVDGVIHLILLFLNRGGNKIVSARPFGLDSLGSKLYFDSFEKLKKRKAKPSGLEIVFISPENEKKELIYFSMNVADFAIRKNKGFKSYLAQMEHFNTYLKGASYLLHKPYFSILRKCILDGSTTIVQDDSGIAFHYFVESGVKWKYKLYGKYTKPISLFAKAYQPDLDSVYKVIGAKETGLGIGYNFKDKNSNLMVATHH